MKKKLVLILMAMICVSLQAGVIDNFDRDDSNVIGNGWTETESAVSRVDVQVKDGELNFLRVGGPSITTAKINRYLDNVSDVSCDMIFEQASVSAAGAARMYLVAKDANGEPITIIVRPDVSTAVQKFTVTYKGVDSWLNVNGSGQWHNYRISVNDNGKTRVYVDRAEKWVSSDAGLGLATFAEIGMHRDWEWVSLKADNFRAISELPAEAISFADDFNRANADDVANGWVEEGSVTQINPQIKDNMLRLSAGSGHSNTTTSASIFKTHDPAGTISADMKMGFPNGDRSNTECGMQTYDEAGTVVRILLFPSASPETGQLVKVFLNTTVVYTTIVANSGAFHNYKVRISDLGVAKVYIDHQLCWQSGEGAIGQSVKSLVKLRRWWEWHYVDVNNFQAIGSDLTDCFDVFEDGLGLATDFNHDCEITLEDFSILAANWMVCNVPEQSGCIETW